MHIQVCSTSYLTNDRTRNLDAYKSGYFFDDEQSQSLVTVLRKSSTEKKRLYRQNSISET